MLMQGNFRQCSRLRRSDKSSGIGFDLVDFDKRRQKGSGRLDRLELRRSTTVFRMTVMVYAGSAESLSMCSSEGPRHLCIPGEMWFAWRNRQHNRNFQDLMSTFTSAEVHRSR